MMIGALIKPGDGKGRLILKGAKFAFGVWVAGGVVEHAKEVCKDQQTKAREKAEEQDLASEKWTEFRRWPGRLARSLRIIRFRTAAMMVYYVLALVVAIKMKDVVCNGGHPGGCKVARAISGGGN